MSWKTELRSILTNSNPVGSIIADRVFPGIIPEGTTLPACAFVTTNNEPTGTKSGPSTLDFVTVDFDIISKRYSEVDSAGEAIRNALENYAGGTNIYRISIRDEAEYFDQKNRLYRLNQEYYITVKRS